MRHAAAIAILLTLASPAAAPASDDLPVDGAALGRLAETSSGRYGLTNLLSLGQIEAAIRGGGSSGLAIDLSHVRELLDGTAIDPAKLYGTAYAGPYPFESKEARFSYKRFRLSASISGGKGTIDVGSLLEPRLNSEGWTDRGQLAVRFVLGLERAGKDRSLGTYDTIVGFEKREGVFIKRPAITEGPLVQLVRSDEPKEAVISFTTPEPLRARVLLAGGDGAERSFWDEWARMRHEIRLTGLRPDTAYTYRVDIGWHTTRPFSLRSAPRTRRDARVRFAYFGDSRSGTGAGEVRHMGVNLATLERLARIAREGDARFLIVGGDLITGYTTVRDDFVAQLRAWKQGLAGYWSDRPVYPCMGNHEALMKRYDNGTRIDRWPYDTDSAEAVFAREFVLPENGPRVSDPRRPPYRENVYSFHHGCVKVIAFNNNYWVSYSSSTYGGSPEGYLMKDQLDWIIRELDEAESDAAVRYVILFAQEPIFPAGGHVGDGMWYRGDNRVRAYVYRSIEGSKKVAPEEEGMLAVRDRFLRAVASHSKVAAVLGSDEHAYHRVLIGPGVPVGDITRDDRNRNGRIDVGLGETASPLADLERSTWFIVCGGGGAPYYAEVETPWSAHWKGRVTSRLGVPGFFYSSQENIVFFDAGPDGIGIEVRSVQGELIDRIEDLMRDR